MAKKWQNSEFLAKSLTKFALFNEQKMAVLVAKSFAFYLVHSKVSCV